jgi:hypothetical protein
MMRNPLFKIDDIVHDKLPSYHQGVTFNYVEKRKRYHLKDNGKGYYYWPSSWMFWCNEGRYPESAFLDYEAIELQRLQRNKANYDTVMAGRNYKTKKPIKIGGATFRKLIRELQCDCCKTIRQYFELECQNFRDIAAIYAQGKEAYLLESVQLKRDCEEKQRLENVRVKALNAQVDDVIARIRLLTNWNDFVEFDGVKYGMSPKPGHDTIDCDGTPELHQDQWLCWKGLCDPITEVFYRCNKCFTPSVEGQYSSTSSNEVQSVTIEYVPCC